MIIGCLHRMEVSCVADVSRKHTAHLQGQGRAGTNRLPGQDNNLVPLQTEFFKCLLLKLIFY